MKNEKEAESKEMAKSNPVMFERKSSHHNI